MRNSRKNRMKKLLEQKLPYPHITVRADRQIDFMLSMLPDQEEASKGRAARKAPAHFKKEPAVQLVYLEEEPPLRRGLKTAAKWALSLSVLCFVCLFLFRWVLPNIAEAQRAARSESSLPIASAQPRPTLEPQPEAEEAVTVDSFAVSGDDITLTMTLPVLPCSPESTATCLPELRLSTDRGDQLELSSAYGLDDADAEASAPEAESAVPSSLESEEEAPRRQDGYLELSPGDPYTVTNTFTGDLTNAKQVIVTVYNLSAESAKVTAFPDGVCRNPIVLAEYTLDLETGTVKPSKTYENLGLNYMSVSEYLEVFGADPIFQNHLWFGGGEAGYIGWQLAEGTNDSYQPLFGIHCWTDTEDDLPYEVNFYLYQGEEPYQSVPLYRTGEETEVSNSGGRLITRHDLYTKSEYPNTQAVKFGMKDSVRRFYTIEILLDEIYPAESMRENPLDATDCYYEIVNIDTGEVLVDSRIAGAVQKLNSASSSPAEGALASSNDVNLMGFQLSGDVLSLDLSYPAFSKTDLAVVEVHTMNASVAEGESLLEKELSEITDPPADSGLTGKFLSEPPAGVRIGDTFTETRQFQVPAGTKNLIVRVRNIPKDMTKDFEDGARISSFVFAEFCLDLRTGKVLASDSYFAEWAEKGYSLNELMTVSDYASLLQLMDRSYEGWVEEQYLGPAILSNYGINKQAPNWMLQFTSDVNLDLPMSVHFTVDGDLKLAEPLYRTDYSEDVKTAKHPDTPNYETRMGEYFFLRVDPQNKAYDGVGAVTTRRLYTAVAIFDDEDYEADPYDLECGDYWNDHTIQVQVVTPNGDVIYDSNICGSGPITESSPVPDPGQYDGS